jgi:hypothetical protein
MNWVRRDEELFNRSKERALAVGQTDWHSFEPFPVYLYKKKIVYERRLAETNIKVEPGHGTLTSDTRGESHAFNRSCCRKKACSKCGRPYKEMPTTLSCTVSRGYPQSPRLVRLVSEFLLPPLASRRCNPHSSSGPSRACPPPAVERTEHTEGPEKRSAPVRSDRQR